MVKKGEDRSRRANINPGGKTGLKAAINSQQTLTTTS